MRSLLVVRSAVGLAALLVSLVAVGLFATAARAGVPTPWTCEIGTVVVLSGTHSGVADPLGAKVIVVRRITSPVAGATVELDFTACGGDEFAFCDPQPDPALAAWESGRFITFADLEGRATFHLTGRSMSAPSAGITTPCAAVRANGVPLGTIRVAAFDLDGRNGVNPTDLSLFLVDSFGSYRTRSDYDGDGAVTPIDLSLFLRASFAGGSATSCGALAP